jgi:hypothetical protein
VIGALFSLPGSAADTPQPSGSGLFPPLERSGTQAIDVHCGRPSPVISFGMPFPKGFVTDSTQIRLETPTGREVAADVTELLRWFDFSQPQSDRSSIRAVLITFRSECTAAKTLS